MALGLTAPSSGKKRQFAKCYSWKALQNKEIQINIKQSSQSHRENVYDNQFSFMLKQHTNTGHVILFYNRHSELIYFS